MCTALEELIAEREELGEARGKARGEARGKAEGKAFGIISMCRDFGLSESETLQTL